MSINGEEVEGSTDAKLKAVNLIMSAERPVTIEFMAGPAFSGMASEASIFSSAERRLSAHLDSGHNPMMQHRGSLPADHSEGSDGNASSDEEASIFSSAEGRLSN